MACNAIPKADVCCPNANALVQQAMAINMNAKAYLDICNSLKGIAFSALGRGGLADALGGRERRLGTGRRNASDGGGDKASGIDMDQCRVSGLAVELKANEDDQCHSVEHQEYAVH